MSFLYGIIIGYVLFSRSLYDDVIDIIKADLDVMEKLKKINKGEMK